jgi:hypothetical protein
MQNLLLVLITEVVSFLGSIARSYLLKDTQTWRLQSVGIYVNHLRTTYILERTHSRILDILSKNVLVELLLCDVHRWMLKNASVSIGAFGRILNEILADRCQVLFVEIWFPLQLMFSVRKSAPIFFVSVGADLAN